MVFAKTADMCGARIVKFLDLLGWISVRGYVIICAKG